MLNHTAIPASPDALVSPKADIVIANSPNPQKYPTQLKINPAIQMPVVRSHGLPDLSLEIGS
jgi:hypothetical protein